MNSQEKQGKNEKDDKKLAVSYDYNDYFVTEHLKYIVLTF